MNSTIKDCKVSIIGCGFIGSSLAKFLSDRYSITTLDVAEQPSWMLKYNIPHKICDIRDYYKLSKEIDNQDIVIHTAIVQIPTINEKKNYAYETNTLGTQNVCDIVSKNPKIKGMILTSSWHVFGDHGHKEMIDENSGYAPYNSEDRAQLYALSKVLQECIVQFYSKMTKNKIFSILRMGTVIGEHMPSQTVASSFIIKALEGKSITPYKHSMYRPMFYVAIEDVCKVFDLYIKLIFKTDKIKTNDFFNMLNIVYPVPITILELAKIVKKYTIECSNRKIKPKVNIVDCGISEPCEPENKNVRFDIGRLNKFLEGDRLIHPETAIYRIIKNATREGIFQI